MCAMAENVVPRSIPIALRAVIAVEKVYRGMPCIPARFECSFRARSGREIQLAPIGAKTRDGADF